MVAPPPRIVIFTDVNSFPEPSGLRQGIANSVCVIYPFPHLTFSPCISSDHDISVRFIFLWSFGTGSLGKPAYWLSNFNPSRNSTVRPPPGKHYHRKINRNTRRSAATTTSKSWFLSVAAAISQSLRGGIRWLLRKTRQSLRKILTWMGLT